MRFDSIRFLEQNIVGVLPPPLLLLLLLPLIFSNNDRKIDGNHHRLDGKRSEEINKYLGQTLKYANIASNVYMRECVFIQAIRISSSFFPLFLSHFSTLQLLCFAFAYSFPYFFLAIYCSTEKIRAKKELGQKNSWMIRQHRQTEHTIDWLYQYLENERFYSAWKARASVKNNSFNVSIAVHIFYLSFASQSCQRDQTAQYATATVTKVFHAAGMQLQSFPLGA